MKLKFKVDTKHRKDWFTGVSFSHPAKMSLPLQLWIIENYTEAGETILDPMAGSGTILVACSLGRNVIAVELESKFIDLMKGNWEKIKQRGAQLGSTMGECQIIQGDARQLEGLVDKIVTSPPYSEGLGHQHRKYGRDIEASKSIQPPEYSRSPDNIGNLPYGQIDKIVTSPPYEGTLDGTGEGPLVTSKKNPSYKPMPSGYSVDSIITSPPYEGSVSASTGGERDMSSARRREERLRGKGYDPAKYQGGVGRNLEVDFQYSKADENIGNLKSQSYLEAMLQVYQQCYKVLKSQGLMILVTKNFIRNKQVIRLDTDTIKLCEQAGFSFVERHERVLPSQSFWRIIYHQKHPEVEQILSEDVLVFSK